MNATLSGISTMHCNLVTDIRVAGETGYDGIEIVDEKLIRYVDQGQEPEMLRDLLARHGVAPRCINALKHVEAQGAACRDMLDRCDRLCDLARTIGCPAVQLVAFEGLADMPQREGLEKTALNVRQIADIGADHGIGFQVEVIAWAPIRSLRQGMELIDRTGRDNVQMVIDFWHLWAGRGTTPDDVARLDKDHIRTVHVCDGKAIPETEPWSESDLRGHLPGDGDVPLRPWVDAVKATGFDGPWVGELLSARHWEWDPWTAATALLERMQVWTPRVA
jgi:sugar phosphate isomerase/epimerase